MLVLLGNSLAPTLRDYFKARVRNDRGVTLLPASIGKFVSSEAFSEIKTTASDLKGQPIAILQSLAAVADHTANDLAMELLLTVRTLKRNGAGPVWVIMPFAGYSRQDRGFNDRMTSVGIDDFAFLLKQAGAEGVSTIEMHSQAGVKLLKDHFGEGQVFNLDPTELFVRDIQENIGVENAVVGGPDAGANDRADSVARSLNAPWFRFKKQHLGVNETEVTGFEGAVAGKNTITIDDMMDTCGTAEHSQKRLANEGALRRIFCASAGLFSNGGLERAFNSFLGNTDFVPLLGISRLIADETEGRKGIAGKLGEYARAYVDKMMTFSQIAVLDTVDMSEKLEDLEQKHGRAEVQRRFRQISTGEMLYNHIVCDVETHPTMKAEVG